MKILFIYPSYENLGVEYLAAVAKAKGHEAALLFDPKLFDDSFVSIKPLARLFNARRSFLAGASSYGPDVVAFSLVTSDYPWFLDVGPLIRKATGARVIVGNIHATSAPESVLERDFVDAVVRGEGEGAFSDILDSLESGGLARDIPNLGIMSEGRPRLNPLRPLIGDLDSLPFPCKEIYSGAPVSPSLVYTISGSRGCPYGCTFCNNNFLRGLYGAAGYMRMRSVGNVIEELRFAVSRYNPGCVNFYDEVFGFNRNWLRGFAEAYAREIGLPCLVCANPNVADAEYAALLKSMNCRKVDIGVQTVAEEKRRIVFGRRETTEQVRESITLLGEQGIFVVAENILDFPGESESDLVEMARFYNETRPGLVKIFWLSYFPRTEMIDIAVRSGKLSAREAEEINRGRAAGEIAVGRARPGLQRKFYILLTLLEFIPARTAEAILAKRLYRFIPAWALPGLAYTLFRIISRKPKDAEIMLRGHSLRYRRFVKMLFRARAVLSRG